MPKSDVVMLEDTYSVGTKPPRKRKQTKKEKPVRVVKEKFARIKAESLPPLTPMNAKQKDYIQKITEKETVIAIGYPGTSKTYVPTVMACDALRIGVRHGGVDKVYITRPNISNSKSLGYMKGDLIEKFSYWLGPVLSIMRERMSLEELSLHIERGNIEFVPFETIKGYSMSDCYIICDEAEDITWDEAKKLVTRQGKNSHMILAGDIQQSELKENSGLKKLISLAEKYPQLNVGVVNFNNVGDIVRSRTVREWIKVMEKEGL